MYSRALCGNQLFSSFFLGGGGGTKWGDRGCVYSCVAFNMGAANGVVARESLQKATDSIRNGEPGTTMPCMYRYVLTSLYSSRSVLPFCLKHLFSSVLRD